LHDLLLSGESESSASPVRRIYSESESRPTLRKERLKIIKYYSTRAPRNLRLLIVSPLKEEQQSATVATQRVTDTRNRRAHEVLPLLPAGAISQSAGISRHPGKRSKRSHACAVTSSTVLFTVVSGNRCARRARTVSHASSRKPHSSIDPCLHAFCQESETIGLTSVNSRTLPPALAKQMRRERRA